MKPSKSQVGRATDLQKAAFDNPMYTRSFHVVEVKGSEGVEENFIDHNVTIILELEKITIVTAYGNCVNFYILKLRYNNL